MVKKIRLLGMEIDNFSLREELGLGEKFLQREELNIIRTVSMGLLSMAAENQAVRDGIAQADLLVIGDEEILSEAGIHSSQRLREAREHIFMHEYAKWVCQNGCQVYLIAQTRADMENLSQFLHAAYETMQIVGTYVLPGHMQPGSLKGIGSWGQMKLSGTKRLELDMVEACDLIVNALNMAAPDIVISVLQPPFEELFLQRSRAKISAKAWYSPGLEFYGTHRKLSLPGRLRQMFTKGRFKSIVHQYEDRHE